MSERSNAWGFPVVEPGGMMPGMAASPDSALSGGVSVAVYAAPPLVTKPGDAPVGREMVQGFSVVIENPKGSIRTWCDAAGKECGSTEMAYAYGFIDGYIGADGEEVDCYIGPDRKSNWVCVVRQMKRPDFTAYDECKVMLAFADEAAAKAAYLGQYNDPRFYGGMSSMPIAVFRQRIEALKPGDAIVHANRGDFTITKGDAGHKEFEYGAKAVPKEFYWTYFDEQAAAKKVNANSIGAAPVDLGRTEPPTLPGEPPVMEDLGERIPKRDDSGAMPAPSDARPAGDGGARPNGPAIEEYFHQPMPPGKKKHVALAAPPAPKLREDFIPHSPEPGEKGYVRPIAGDPTIPNPMFPKGPRQNPFVEPALRDGEQPSAFESGTPPETHPGRPEGLER